MKKMLQGAKYKSWLLWKLFIEKKKSLKRAKAHFSGDISAKCFRMWKQTTLSRKTNKEKALYATNRMRHLVTRNQLVAEDTTNC